MTSGTLTATGFLTVGGTGTGILAATNAFLGGSSFTAADGFNSSATVSLTGSRLDATNGFLTVGNGGTASMTVVSSTMTSTFGDISFHATSSGTLTLTNSVWNNSLDIDIGGSGFGTVRLNGGAVTARDTELDGAFSNGGGTVLVTAGTWAAARTLIVGSSGTGTLTISGGVVSGSSAVLGDFFSQGNGTVTVTGGTFSTLANLTVNASGTGRLAVGSGGLVTVGGTLSRGTFGTIVVDPGGTLRIGAGGTTGALATAITTNGTLVFNRSGSSSCTVAIGGTGGLVKQGTGVLTLTGSNGLSGAATVQQGVLRLAHSAALGAARVTPLAGGTVSLTPRLQATFGGLDPLAGGLVDVGNGRVSVANGLSNASLLAALVAGRGDGAWNGTAGIVSATARAEVANGVLRAVGWLDNGDGSKTFAYAAPGDTNLDWEVDLLDAANFVAGGKFDALAAATWSEGDFTYDGAVDILDAADFLSTGLYDAGGYNGSGAVGVAAVPEPSAAAALLIAGAMGLVSRRRRGRPRAA